MNNLTTKYSDAIEANDFRICSTIVRRSYNELPFEILKSHYEKVSYWDLRDYYLNNIENINLYNYQLMYKLHIQYSSNYSQYDKELVAKIVDLFFADAEFKDYVIAFESGLQFIGSEYPSLPSLSALIHHAALLNFFTRSDFAVDCTHKILMTGNLDKTNVVELEIPFYLTFVREPTHWQNTMIVFIESLCDYLTTEGLSVIPRLKFSIHPSPPHSEYLLLITHHTTGFTPKRFHYKNSHLSGFVELDPLGFSSFSSLSLAKYDPIFDARAFDYVNKLFVDRTYPKIVQPDKLFKKDSKRFAILVTMQVPWDRVQHKSFIDTTNLVLILKSLLQDDEILYVKRHPLDNSKYTKNLLQSITSERVIIVDCDIYSLIEGVDLVVTSNSGTGFEACCMHKPVIVTGIVDYHECVMVAKNQSELRSHINASKSCNSFDISLTSRHHQNYFFVEATRNDKFNFFKKKLSSDSSKFI